MSAVSVTGARPGAVPVRFGTRVRRAVAGLKRLDHRAGRLLGPRVVLVEARTPMNLAVLRPVFETLLADPRLSVRFTSTARDDVSRVLSTVGLADRMIERRTAEWMRVDLYMNADPWQAMPLRRAARQVNFFHGVAGKYDLDCPASLPIGFERYDRVAFPNEGRRARYLAAGIVTAEQAVLVGFPKIDPLVHDAGNPRAKSAALGLDPGRPTVVYAPTFSPASSLHRGGEAIVETVLEAGCNVIVKLHDRSLDPDPRYSGGVDWRRRMARFEQPGRFLFADDSDSTPYVLASDAMISDHSSIAFEFCVLDRPLIVYEAPGLVETARINPDKVRLLRSAAIVVADPAALRGALELATTRPDVLAHERRRVAGQVFHGPGSATARALHVVYELLELSPAAGVTTNQSLRAWSSVK